MNIDIACRQTDVDLSRFLPFVPVLVSAVMEMEKIRCDHLSLQFLSDSTMRRYHLRFFDDGSSTDCMSFPIDLDDPSEQYHLGEVLVCPKTALKYLKKQGLAQEALFREIALYIIHGILHLIGYDDTTDQKRRLMRKKEAAAMTLFESNSKIDWSSMLQEGIPQDGML